MKIDHVAIWVHDLEKMKTFYTDWFGGTAGEMYQNQMTGFTSYFISFNGHCRLELMHRDSIPANLNDPITQCIGINHLAYNVGSKDEVDSLTHKLKNEGYTVIGEPRTTGDGYYESVILDPENNRIEITV